MVSITLEKPHELPIESTEASSTRTERVQLGDEGLRLEDDGPSRPFLVLPDGGESGWSERRGSAELKKKKCQLGCHHHAGAQFTRPAVMDLHGAS
jgi:hypothetical protein